MTKKALLIGATGLVGKSLLYQLINDQRYSEVVALVRRPLLIAHPKLKIVVLDFDNPDKSLLTGDDLFCALGTTIRTAGSQAAQFRVDCEYPAEIGRIARENGVKQYLLVSSIGANPDSSNFYLRTKGELENRIKDLHFDCFVTAQPSLLLGDRKEFRFGEKIGIFLNAVFNLIIPAKYKGVKASQVANALITLANQHLGGTHVITSDVLRKY